MPLLSAPRLVVAYGVTNFHQLWRFVFVGLVTFGIYFLCFTLLYKTLGFHYGVAVSLAYPATVTAHFFMNKLFTFGARAHRIRYSAPRYAVLLAVNYGLTLLLAWLTVDVAGASPYVALAVSTAGTSVSTFLSMKYFVFRRLPAAS